MTIYRESILITSVLPEKLNKLCEETSHELKEEVIFG